MLINVSKINKTYITDKYLNKQSHMKLISHLI